MNKVIPVLLVLFVVVFFVRFFLIKQINGLNVFPFKMKENSMSFFTKGSFDEDSHLKGLLKKYNLKTLLMWILSITAFVIAILDNM